ncbi:MAG: DUF2914 domain-containing protein [Bdellovibrionales bacterium]
MSTAEAATPIPPPKNGLAQMRAYYERHEHRLAIAFFVGGFLLDIFTLDRIDSWFTIGQQALYLLVILAALMQMFFEEANPPRATENMFVVKRWYFEYRTAIVHFFFGNLLNLYTIFFFKSSSLLVSFGFLIFLIVLLVANESNRFKSMGLAFKFGLFSLCLLAFSAYVVPIFVGSISMIVFLLSMVVGCLPLVGISWWIQTYAPQYFEHAKSQILVPMAIVLSGFLGLYMLKLIPPVPLSIPFIGVYHQIEKVDEGYRMSHERPWWRFWHNGDQKFFAQRADKVYVAFRIFSPTRFSDQVLMRWYWRDNQQGWLLQDSIPIKIIGGREEGFRGFGFKSNYQPGDWKIQVETRDGREIGRVYFNLEIAPEQPRSFEYDLM